MHATNIDGENIGRKVRALGDPARYKWPKIRIAIRTSFLERFLLLTACGRRLNVTTTFAFSTALPHAVQYSIILCLYFLEIGIMRSDTRGVSPMKEVYLY